ncbi:MAG: hypothetical protein U0798_07835 [Gemmataceae bacterium]
MQNGPGGITLTVGNTYTGGTTVNNGVLTVTDDTQLGAGSGGLQVNGPGVAEFESVTTSRTITQSGTGRITVQSGETLTLDAATIQGGTISGPGTIEIQSSTTLDGVRIDTTAIVTLVGETTIENSTNAGVITVPANVTANLNSFTNESSGRITIDGTSSKAEVNEFTSNGYIEVLNGGTLKNGGASVIILGGGSMLNIGYTESIGAGSGPVGGLGGTAADRMGRGFVDLADGGLQALGSAVVRNNGFIDSSTEPDDLSQLHLQYGAIYLFDVNFANGLGDYVDFVSLGGTAKAM